MSEPILLALSRLNAYFDCSRKYYWSYEYKGSGLGGTKVPIPLAIGGAVHSGLQVLLHGVDIETAVTQAVNEFDTRISKGGAILSPTEDVLFVYQEQRYLIEALVRVYAIKGLPNLLNEYEIVNIEQEYDLKLSDNVIIRTRADGLLRHRENGRLYLLSFKTAKRYDRRYGDSGHHDVQGLSEAAAVEEQLGEEILGVQMQYLIKGDRYESGQGSGKYHQDTILLHPWVKIDSLNSGESPEFAVNWKWTDETGRGHTLGKSYTRCNIWEHMSTSDWIHILSGHGESKIGTLAALANVLISPPPYYRRREEIDSWKTQTRALGESLHNRRESSRLETVEGRRLIDTIDENYPMNRRSCDWPSPCTYKAICHGSLGTDPEDSGLYRIRREWKVEDPD